MRELTVANTSMAAALAHADAGAGQAQQREAALAEEVRAGPECDVGGVSL